MFGIRRLEVKNSEYGEPASVYSVGFYNPHTGQWIEHLHSSEVKTPEVWCSFLNGGLKPHERTYGNVTRNR